MNLFLKRLKNRDARSLDQYWDRLQQPNQFTLIPPAPTELTTIIQRSQLAATADRSTPPFADALLDRLLEAQQESITMNAHTGVVTLKPVKPVPFTTMREPRSIRPGWAAVAVLILIGALVFSIWKLQDNPDDNRVLVAPTAAATPSQNPESTSPGDTNGIVWEAGIGEDAMINPIFLTIAPDGTIWIPDSGRNQIRIYSTDGELLDTWGETGSGNGQFDFARSPGDPTSALSDVAFDREGNFYIVDPGNKRVQKFAPDRTFLLAWGSGGTGDGQFADPVTVNIGLNDVVYVSDDVLNTVQMFDSNGQFLGRFGSFGTAPGQMDSGAIGSIDGDGNVWYADTLNNRVQVFSPDGEFLYGFGEVGMGAGQFLNLNDVFAAPNGLIYVSDFEAFRIQVFTAEGKLLSFWLAQDQSSHLIGVAVDEAGYMYVAKPETGTLIKVKPDVPAEPFDGTKVVNPISAKPQPAAATTDWSVDLSASGGGVPSSITVAPDGTIWVPDETNDTIIILGADGTYQETWGSSGTGPGQFRSVRTR